MSSLTLRNGSVYVTYYFDGGEHVASQVGDTRGLGSITTSGSTQSGNVTFRKSFRWELSADPTSGWTYEYSGRPRTLGVLVNGQSNQEGRGDETGLPAPANAEHISPNTYPYDENASGPGPPSVVGPAIMFADALLSDPRFNYERVSIYCAATGNQSIADLYGTDGTDGNFATQAGDNDVLGGPITVARCLIKPGDDYVIWSGPGEADASSGVTTTYAADLTVLLDYIRSPYLAGATCKAIVIAVMGDTAAGGATQERQDIVVAQQESMRNPNASPPVYTIKYEDSDRTPGDLIHYSAAGHARCAPIAADELLDAGVFG